MLYADDLLLFKPISRDLSSFQCDVNLISQWTLQTIFLTVTRLSTCLFPETGLVAATISISQFMYTTIKLKEFIDTNT